MQSLNEQVYFSIRQMSQAASASMRGLLTSQLHKPLNSNGIISQLGIEVKKVGSDEVVASTHLPSYAYWVEHGRGPGKMPPMGVLRNWMKIKGIDEAAEYPIRRKIAKEGTPARPFLSPLENMVKNIEAMAKGMGVKFTVDSLFGVIENTDIQMNI